jgi:hypothetical protein
MVSSAISPRAGKNPALPDDLAEWLGAVRLTNLALSALADVESPRSEFRAPGADEGHGFRMLLTLMSYAYARGIYGSAEMAERIAIDPDLRYLATAAQPTAQTIRQFRRQNRMLLHAALARLLALSTGSSEQDAWFNAAAEADLRLDRATAADSYALDC